MNLLYGFSTVHGICPQFAYFRNHCTSGRRAYFRLHVQLSQGFAESVHIFAYYPVWRGAHWRMRPPHTQNGNEHKAQGRDRRHAGIDHQSTTP